MGKPTIRFEGYTDDWEQRKFGEIVEKYEDPVETPTEGYTRLGIRSHAKGTFHSYVEKGKELETAKMFRVAADKFIVNITFGWEHAVAITDENDAGKLVSHRFPQYSFNAGMEPKFFRYLILDENFKHHLELSSPGGAGRNRVLKLSDMLQYKMNFPSEAEQKKIAAYFDDLDHLITLHQRKCEETKILKKYMLQKMFPQNEQKVPEIRFKGFTDDWEQRKLGDITELKSASRVHKDEWTSNGVPFYRSSDVMAAINGTENEKAFISEELYEKLSKVSGKLEEGDILVTGGGSVGNPYIVLDNKPLYTKDADLLWIKNKGKFHPYFLYEFFFSPTFRNYLRSISHVGTIAHYTITQLSDTPIYLPSFEEQKEVGEYFQSLDHLITLHQRKCEELQKIKKFMLQNMFV